MRKRPAKPVFPVVLAVAVAVVAAATWACSAARAQPATQGAGPAAPAATPSPAAAQSLEALAWLRGCWKGEVNRREFLEQWSPARGGMMVGISHTVVAPKFQGGTVKEKMDAAGKTKADPASEKTQDYEYLRLETRPDGVYYVAIPAGKKEIAFRLTDVADDKGARLFTFSNAVDEFPQRIVYGHGSGGWLYAQVLGKPGEAGKDVTYPMQHVDCATGAIAKE